MPRNAQKAAALARKLRKARSPRSARDRDQANQSQFDLRVSQRHRRLVQELRAMADNTYNAPRRAGALDLAIFQEIERSLRLGMTVRLSASRSAPVIRLIHAPSADQRQANERGDKKRVIAGMLEKRVWVPHWDRTGIHMKAFAWSMMMFEMGAYAMTLHLAESVVKAASGDPKGFAQHLRERIRRELQKVFRDAGLDAPEFFFFVEATLLGKVHLHGALERLDHPEANKLARMALYRACGFGQGPRTGREIDLRDLSTPARWCEYVAKWHLDTSRRLQDPSIAATKKLRNRARDWHNEMRNTERAITQIIDNGDIIRLSP